MTYTAYFNSNLEQYLVFADGVMIGQAIDIAGVGDIIHIFQDKNEYSSKICDNESSGASTNSAVEKSQ